MRKVKSLPGEVWKWIPGYVKAYKVSDMGRVKSVRRMVKGKNSDGGTYRKFFPEKLIAPYPKKGYPVVILHNEKGEKRFKVHTLVLITFVGPRPPGMECRHLDDDKDNPRLDNLVWGTRSENTKDQYRNHCRISRKGIPRKMSARKFLVEESKRRKKLKSMP